MYFPDEKEFIKLSKKGNIIPVYREMLADFDTPLSAFVKIDEGDFSYLLESVEGGERLGRYSFLGSKPSVVVKSKGGRITIKKGRSEETFKAKKDPVDEIKKIMDSFRLVPVPGLPRFFGGFVGYIGYDMVRFFEKIPDKNPDKLGMPDMQFMLTDTILIFDHVDRKIKIVSNAHVGPDPAASYKEAVRKIDRLYAMLQKNVQTPAMKKRKKLPAKERSNFTQKAFAAAVEKAKKHIRCGDIIQVVLSQRFERTTTADPFSIYRALRSINPSPYMFYLKFGKHRLIGSSPEILVRCEEGLVEVRPIAGTRKRGDNEEEDRLLEKELLADPKERAEHIMLVDLGRNDIGRVCEYGSVQAREIMCIEKYSHVMHIVSDVIGSLRKENDVYDLIRATFPAGTVTGAPKVKAMELIEKYENTRRGPYAGCAGYISFSGNLDMCITIRTIIIAGGKAYVQSGAGIVLDSVPEKEYQETINKAKAMMKAIEFAES